MALNGVASSYESFRTLLMSQQKQGVTALYGDFHDCDQANLSLRKLRDLHVEMDLAVAAAYGWSDLKLDHGFHETKQGVRFTISESARRKVLDRLLALNHQRYAEEVAAGLHDKNKAKKAKAQKPAASAKPAPAPAPSPQLALFFDASQPAAAPAPAPAAPPAPSPVVASAPELDPTALAILGFLRRALGPMAKADILEETRLPEDAWKPAIDHLKATGLVETVGAGRGTKYRLRSRS